MSQTAHEQAPPIFLCHRPTTHQIPHFWPCKPIPATGGNRFSRGTPRIEVPPLLISPLQLADCVLHTHAKFSTQSNHPCGNVSCGLRISITPPQNFSHAWKTSVPIDRSFRNEVVDSSCMLGSSEYTPATIAGRLSNCCTRGTPLSAHHFRSPFPSTAMAANNSRTNGRPKHHHHPPNKSNPKFTSARHNRQPFQIANHRLPDPYLNSRNP